MHWLFRYASKYIFLNEKKFLIDSNVKILGRNYWYARFWQKLLLFLQGVMWCRIGDAVQFVYSIQLDDNIKNHKYIRRKRSLPDINCTNFLHLSFGNIIFLPPALANNVFVFFVLFPCLYRCSTVVDVTYLWVFSRLYYDLVLHTLTLLFTKLEINAIFLISTSPTPTVCGL